MLDKKELLMVKGGASFSLTLVIGSAIAFVIGVVQGLLSTVGCKDEA